MERKTNLHNAFLIIISTLIPFLACAYIYFSVLNARPLGEEAMIQATQVACNNIEYLLVGPKEFIPVMIIISIILFTIIKFRHQIFRIKEDKSR